MRKYSRDGKKENSNHLNLFINVCLFELICIESLTFIPSGVCWELTVYVWQQERFYPPVLISVMITMDRISCLHLWRDCVLDFLSPSSHQQLCIFQHPLISELLNVLLSPPPLHTLSSRSVSLCWYILVSEARSYALSLSQTHTHTHTHYRLCFHLLALQRVRSDLHSCLVCSATSEEDTTHSFP